MSQMLPDVPPPRSTQYWAGRTEVEACVTLREDLCRNFLNPRPMIGYRCASSQRVWCQRSDGLTPKLVRFPCPELVAEFLTTVICRFCGSYTAKLCQDHARWLFEDLVTPGFAVCLGTGRGRHHIVSIEQMTPMI